MGTPVKKGKKRKSVVTPSTPRTTARKARKQTELLKIDKYRPQLIGTRILSCGEGEQIGHPGRTVTKKPRAVETFPVATEFIQVAAGGVHSLVLTNDGTIYSCGINEKGTVPVLGLAPEETTDQFTQIIFSSEIIKLGKVVQVTAGASFSAALTEKGSVIAWGNLRDTQGEVTVHETLNEIQKAPVVVFHHKKAGNKKIVKISAGENHLAMLSERGELLTFGEGSMGQLGRSVRTNHIRSRYMVDDTGSSLTLHVLEKGKFIFFTDLWAKGFWTIAKAEDGRIFACGLNNFGQLGVSKKGPILRTRKSISNARRKSDEDGKATVVGPVSLTFDSLEISALNQNSDDSSQEQEQVNSGDGESSAYEDKDDNAVTIPAKNEKSENEHFGNEEIEKIGLISCAEAFPSDKVWTNFAGVQHVICRNEDGEIWAIGKNTDNALGLGTWANNDDKEHWRYDSLQLVSLPDGAKAAGLDATLGASIVWTEDGKVFAFGCDTVGQLGLGIKDDEDKIVPTPRTINSAHLEGYRVISASIADNHSLFLATNVQEPKISNGSLV